MNQVRKGELKQISEKYESENQRNCSVHLNRED